MGSLLKDFDDVTYDDTHFEVHINPTMNCNFKCWYCYETHIKKSRLEEATIKKIQLLLQHIVKEYKSLKTFQLNWFGGEPLLYFDSTVAPILEYAYKLFTAHNISYQSVFTSNRLLINEKVIATCKKYNVTSFQITLDGHRDRHNKVRFVSEKRGSYDEIVNNIKLLVENNIHVNIRINCSAETIEGLEKIAQDFMDVQNEKKLADNILIEYMDYFREQGFFVHSLNLNTFKKMCYADRKNMVNINYDGNLFKCTARDYTQENTEGVLGTDGQLIWNSKHEQRLNSKYKNPPCLACSYLPVCGSGCSQIAIESKEEYCIYDFDETKKQKMLLDNFLGNLSNTELLAN
ncbi:radical SAM protein [Elizabethkingia argentiflava]|uniref:Radical SAM protein n=1 Tax=Elizabethkingia argenteiflava TaxID=2681556 RepID=A0A845PQ26_9FLAO|nr:radical SAM protein [Elizabethkingia argenteiflava]NAW49924.1 radical SAM protein [Elizabethkingia argenteiflava]